MSELAKNCKLTPKIAEGIIELIKAGIPKSHACAAVGMTDRTLWNWINRGEEAAEKNEEDRDETDNLFLAFLVRVRAAEEVFIADQINRVKLGGVRVHKDGKGKQWQTGDWRANQFLLERRFPKQFGQVNRLDVSEMKIPRIEFVEVKREDKADAED